MRTRSRLPVVQFVTAIAASAVLLAQPALALCRCSGCPANAVATIAESKPAICCSLCSPGEQSGPADSGSLCASTCSEGILQPGSGCECSAKPVNVVSLNPARGDDLYAGPVGLLPAAVTFQAASAPGPQLAVVDQINGGAPLGLRLHAYLSVWRN